MDLDEPLFAFANITYRVEEEIDLPRGYRASRQFSVTSLEHQVAPHQLRQTGVKPTVERGRLIDDFRRGWQGKVPTFRNLRWEGGEFAPRPKPYLSKGGSIIDADAAFRNQFEKEVEESVNRERRDLKH